MSECNDLFYLSIIACQMASNSTTDELAIMAADLTVLADMLNAIAVKRSGTENDEVSVPDTTPPSNTPPCSCRCCTPCPPPCCPTSNT